VRDLAIGAASQGNADVLVFSLRRAGHMVSLLHSQDYGRDDQRREVLVGLTYEETIELTILNALPLAPGSIPWEAQASEFPPSEGRWLELYARHLAACGWVGK
jgi:hypothetical protein